MRTAIYARYSSDLQSDASIEDQVALCRSTAKRDGLVVTKVFYDRAMSGSTVHGRLGYQNMVKEASLQQFDCILVESLDRISRDQADLSGFYKRMSFLGIEIREVNGGKATNLNVSVRGLISSIYLTDLTAKTHRGLAGRIRAGKSAGGKCYGYRPVLGKPGELEIEPSEAAIIREIFKAYAEGASPRGIAGQLNARKVPPPRGRHWNASTINGNPIRGNGILQNSIYVGDIVWNRVKMVRNPDTGRRVSRPNPESEWHTNQRPDLAILTREEWDVVQRARRRRRSVAPSRARQPAHPLSGLLRCHCCGGGMSIKDHVGHTTRIQCSTRRESGSCENHHTFKLGRIETAVFSGLERLLGDRETMETYMDAYMAERRRIQALRANNRDTAEARLVTVNRELERAMDAIISGVVRAETMAARIQAMEAERDEIMRQIAESASVPLLPLSDAALRRFQDCARILSGVVESFPVDHLQGVIASIRELISSVTVFGDYQLDVRARITALVLPGTEVGVFSGSGGALPLNPPTSEPCHIFRMAA